MRARVRSKGRLSDFGRRGSSLAYGGVSCQFGQLRCGKFCGVGLGLRGLVTGRDVADGGRGEEWAPAFAGVGNGDGGGGIAFKQMGYVSN